jgi:carbon monoxide dehydrogenase subunit G
MKMEQSFEVKAPIDQVWDLLIDLERVAPCLPGAAITERDDEGTYHGTFQVKLGPTTAAYRGQIRLEDVDKASHTATMKAHGSDKRGQGGANATIVNKLVATEDGGTRVEAVTDMTITGRLARFGRGGMIEDISNRLMRDFADCLQKGLVGDGAEPEAPAVVPAPPATEPAMTPGDAAASAAAEARPEDSAAEGKSPAEVGLADQPSAPPPSAAEPPAAREFRPPEPAKPIHGIRLFFSVLWERIRRLFGGGKK